MKKSLPLILLACTVTASAPASAAAGGSANCAGSIASNSHGVPAFVADLMAGFGWAFGYWVSYDCDIPDD